MATNLSNNKKFPIPGGTIRDNRMSDVQAIKTALVAIDDALVSSMTANFPGNVSACIGTSRNYPNKTIHINSADVWLSEIGETALIVNLLKNNSVIKTFTLYPNQIKISEVFSEKIVMTTSDYFTINIVSGTGRDLIVRMNY